MAFVATSAPSGWKLGRWTATSQTTWQEQKLDDPKLTYQFQVVSGASMPGSSTVRLKMKDQNTEVLLLAASAQVFVGGKHLGEYGGAWEAGGKAAGQKAAPPPASAASRGAKAAAPAPVAAAPAPAAAAPAPKASPPSSRPASKTEGQDPAFEQTLVPQKSAPPPRPAPQAAAPAARPAISAAPAPTVGEPTRARKPEGLDKSAASMQKLCDAAKSGDVAKVNELLAAGIDPDGPAKDGKTPLMAAVGAGSQAVVEALLAAFADPTLGKGDDTPLTIAFTKGNQAILKVLFSSSFSNLNSMVGGFQEIPDAPVRSENQDVPDNAMDELRGITTMIVGQNREKPNSPSHQKYGNYANLSSTIQSTTEQDSDMLRQEAVKLTMKSLAKTTKEGGLGDVRPTSP